MNYKEQYKHPEWQKKRLKIMERDNFQCQACFSRNKTLVIHHKYYYNDFDIWEYEDECYVTLCRNCHNDYHIKNKNRALFDYWQWLLCERITQIGDKEGRGGYQTAIQILTAYVIKVEEI